MAMRAPNRKPVRRENSDCSLRGKIAFPLGHVGVVARNPDCGSRKDLNRNLVRQRNRKHESFDFMKPVRTTAKNPQLQIDFAGRAQLHGARILRK